MRKKKILRNMTIKEIENEIVEEFAVFTDWMDKYEYIIELGKGVPVIDEGQKTEDNLIKGCQSRVWLSCRVEDGKLYFHCGRAGHRLDALQRSGKASFCVYDGGCCEQGDWALRFKSVILFGEIEIIDDPARVVEITAKLCRKFTQDEAYIKAEIAQHAHRTLLLAMTPLHICGKSVKES